MIGSSTAGVLPIAAPENSAVTGATYYLSPTGSDGNDGKSLSTPWLSIRHNVQCGDVILAAPSTSYIGWNFDFNWGNVSCPSADNVAWLRCASFDHCKIIEHNTGAIAVDQSYWGVEGFEVQASPGSLDVGCFSARPNYDKPVGIHHIIFANNIANGCQGGGFTTSNNGKTASVDYIAFIGNIAFNASQGKAACASGFSVYQPIQSDSLSGTHIYAAGNFSYSNLEPDSCAGGKPTDGEGLIFDTFDGDQGELPAAYAAQAVAENNMLLGNGGRGLQVGNNRKRKSASAVTYLRNNTAWGNNRDPRQNTNTTCSEFSLFNTATTTMSRNIGVSSARRGCGGNAIYAFYAYLADETDEISGNWAYALSGSHTGSASSTGFANSHTDRVGMNPKFANPRIPNAPYCESFANVTSCMATVIADFTPRNAAASGFGYQQPKATPEYDPLFPRWLCHVTLPSGLITMGCVSAGI